MFEVRTGELVAQLGGELLGDAAARRCVALPRWTPPRPDDIGFLSNPRYLALLQQSAAGCVIVGPAQREAVAARPSAIVSADPYLYYARLTQWWALRTRQPATPGVHPSAVVEPGARIHAASQRRRAGPCRRRRGRRPRRGRRAAMPRRRPCHDRRAQPPRGAGGGGRALPHRRALHPAWRRGHRRRRLRLRACTGPLGEDRAAGRGGHRRRRRDRRQQLRRPWRAARHRAGARASSSTTWCISRTTWWSARTPRWPPAWALPAARASARTAPSPGRRGVVGHVQICDHVHIGAACAVTRSIHKPGSYGGMFPFDENGVVGQERRHPAAAACAARPHCAHWKARTT